MPPEITPQHITAVLCLTAGLILAVLTWVIFFDQLKTRANAKASDWWLCVSGRVINTGLIDRGRRLGWEPLVEYEYEVRGHTYHGKTIAFRFYQKQWLEDAQAWLDKYPVGSDVLVFYDTDFPQTCTLVPGDEGLSLSALFTVPIILAISSSVCILLGLDGLLGFWR